MTTTCPAPAPGDIVSVAADLPDTLVRHVAVTRIEGRHLWGPLSRSYVELATDIDLITSVLAYQLAVQADLYLLVCTRPGTHWCRADRGRRARSRVLSASGPVSGTSPIGGGRHRLVYRWCPARWTT